MTVIKSSTGLRWEHRENDEEELPQSEHRVHRQLVGKLLWIDRTDLHCAMSKASSSLGRASGRDMKNIKAILRYLRGNLGVMVVEVVRCEKICWKTCFYVQ